MTIPHRSAVLAVLTRGGLLAVLAVAAVPLAEAAQRVHFKNGHVLVVERAREAGSTVYLTLRDGSEVGFPKALIAEVETKAGLRSTRPRSGKSNVVRGPGLADLQARPGTAKPPGHVRDGKVIDSGWDSERSPDYKGPRTLGYGRYGSSIEQSAGRPSAEQVSMREARRIMERRRASKNIVDPKNPDEGTGPAIAQPRLARPPSRETGQSGSSGKR